MRSLSYRTFSINNKKYIFSREGFNKAIKDYRVNRSDEGKLKKLNDSFQDIADELNISVDAIKKWRYGHNGPGDIEIIKNMALVLECDYMELLIEQNQEGYKQNNCNISIDMSIAKEETDILKSLLGDLMSLIEDYSCKEFPEIGFGECDENSEYYSKWLTEITIKLRKSSFGISRENYNKFERLYMETRFFLEYYGTRKIIRWCNINPLFNMFSCTSIEEMKDGLDWDLLVNTDEYYLDESVREYLRDELESYCNGHICWDPPLTLIAMKFGTWYLDIVRNDFPELFID